MRILSSTQIEDRVNNQTFFPDHPQFPNALILAIFSTLTDAEGFEARKTSCSWYKVSDMLKIQRYGPVDEFKKLMNDSSMTRATKLQQLMILYDSIRPDLKLQFAKLTDDGYNKETVLHMAAREKNTELLLHILQSIPAMHRKDYLLKSNNIGISAFLLITQDFQAKKDMGNKVLSVLARHEITQIESKITNYGWNYDYKEPGPYDTPGYIDCPHEYKYLAV